MGGRGLPTARGAGWAAGADRGWGPATCTCTPPVLVSASVVHLGIRRHRWGALLLRLRLRQVRPVIVAGSRTFVEKAVKEAEGQYLNLRDRAVSGEFSPWVRGWHGGQGDDHRGWRV